MAESEKESKKSNCSIVKLNLKLPLALAAVKTGLSSNVDLEKKNIDQNAEYGTFVFCGKDIKLLNQKLNDYQNKEYKKVEDFSDILDDDEDFWKKYQVDTLINVNIPTPIGKGGSDREMNINYKKLATSLDISDVINIDM